MSVERGLLLGAGLALVGALGCQRRAKPPAGLASAAEFLFAHGLADPTGLPYRVLRLFIPPTAGAVDFNLTPTPQGVFTQVATHAWMLSDGRVLFWNGLTRTESFGFSYRASVRQDIEEGLKRQAPYFATPRYQPFVPFSEAQGLGFGDGGDGAEERQRFVAPLFLPTAWALLWRLKRDDALETLFGALEAGGVKVTDPFVPMAQHFLWARFVHLLSRHRSAFEVGTLAADAQALAKLAEGFRAEARRRSIPGDPFRFVDEVTLLAADATRRQTGAPPLPKDPVAAAIRRFDEIAVVPASIGGPLPLDQHPLADTVLQAGAQAIPALRACHDHDKRLTRSLRLDRDTERGRQLVPVADVARACLKRLE